MKFYVIITFLIMFITSRISDNNCDKPCNLGTICVNGKCIGKVAGGSTTVGSDIAKWKKKKKSLK
jgi:hypothetical protein